MYMDIVRSIAELIPYQAAWDQQRQWHAEVVSGARPPTLWLLQHEDVYTAGKRTASWDRPTDGTPVVDVDRGGKITWHGPGQLIGYPLVPLPQPIDVVAYVRTLESAVMAVCAAFGVPTVRIENRSGVWVAGEQGLPDRKICAIGVRVAQGVTMHGLALNCNSDLAQFNRIVPCGISDAGVTSLSVEVGEEITVQQALPVMQVELRNALTQFGVPVAENQEA